MSILASFSVVLTPCGYKLEGPLQKLRDASAILQDSRVFQNHKQNKCSLQTTPSQVDDGDRRRAKGNTWLQLKCMSEHDKEVKVKQEQVSGRNERILGGRGWE